MLTKKEIEKKIIDIISNDVKDGILDQDLMKKLGITKNTTFARHYYTIKKKLVKSGKMEIGYRGKFSVNFLPENTQLVFKKWGKLKKDRKKSFTYNNIKKHFQNDDYQIELEKKIKFNRDHLNCFKLGMEIVITAISINKKLNDYDDPLGEEANPLKMYIEYSNWNDKDYILIQKAIGFSDPYTIGILGENKSINSEVLDIWLKIKKYLGFLKGDEYVDIFQYGFSIGLFLLNIHESEAYNIIIDGIKTYSKKFRINSEDTNDFLEKNNIDGVHDDLNSLCNIIISYYIKILASLESKIK